MMMMVTMMKLITISVVVLRFYKCVVEEALLGKDPDGAEDFSAGLTHQYHHHPHYHNRHHNHPPLVNFD